MKNIFLKLFVVLVVVVAISLPLGDLSQVWAANTKEEAFRYREDGDICVCARYKRDVLFGGAENELPADLRKTLSLCNKYKGKTNKRQVDILPMANCPGAF